MKAEDYTGCFVRHCSNETINGEYEPWLAKMHADMAVSNAQFELIEEAAKWIEKHVGNYINSEYDGTIDTDGMIEDFKKAFKVIPTFNLGDSVSYDAQTLQIDGYGRLRNSGEQYYILSDGTIVYEKDWHKLN